MLWKRRRKNKVWLNTLAGAAGGLLGAWAMNQFQAGVAKLQTAKAPQPPPGQQQWQEEPATLKAGEQIVEAVTGRELTASQKQIAEPLVHYGFGALVGAIYGALAAKVPRASAGAGTVYGTAVWLLADEIGVPAAGLSKPAWAVPLASHVEALASHLVYGLTTEGVRWLAGKTRLA